MLSCRGMISILGVVIMTFGDILCIWVLGPLGYCLGKDL